MSKQIQAQAAKLWQTVTDPETGATYKKTTLVTWTLIRETGYLLWLVVCLVLVLGEWIWKSGYRAGWSVREWINSFEQPTTDRLLSETGKTLLTAGKTGVAIALSTARDQLGIEAAPEPLPDSALLTPSPSPTPIATPEPPKPVSEPKPTVSPSTPPSPAAAAAEPADDE